MTSHQLCSFFYSDLGEGLFQCKKCGCKRKQASGSGYSNLLGHMGAKHAGYASTLNSKPLPPPQPSTCSVRTMKTYMRFTAAKVGQTIEGEMGESFALMYDGWTCHSLHFLGIFAVYVVNG
ncbi:hypothetical protein F442_22905, partial [Phytophthora nicotianae P10297]